MTKYRHSGFVAATHTAFSPDGTLNLRAIEAQAAQLLKQNINTAFVSGSTGECSSLTLEERKAATKRWVEVARGTPLKIMVHVGANCLPDAQALAKQAGELGVLAISALAPCYFKPRNLAALIEWNAAIAACAPQTPYYYYDIPVLTGVSFPMVDFLSQAADRIPTLGGIKFTSYDLFSYQLCLNLDDRAFDVFWGADEAILGALAMGGQSAIGTSYNYAAPVFHRMIRAVRAGDLDTARKEQFRIAQLIQCFIKYGVLPATKVLMDMLGVDVGNCRAPHGNLTAEQKTALRADLEQLGYFEWLKPDGVRADQPVTVGNGTNGH